MPRARICIGTLPTLAAAAIFLNACSPLYECNDRSATIMPRGQEILIGQEYFTELIQLEGGPFNADPHLLSYVQRVGKRVLDAAPTGAFPYKIVVLNSSIPNAWSLPGGKIALSRGLLLDLRSEAELAAILSLEISHSEAGHGIDLVHDRVKELMPHHRTAHYHPQYSLREELEAEEMAFERLTKAGYSAQAMVHLQSGFQYLAERRQSLWWTGRFASRVPSKERLTLSKELASAYSYEGELRGRDYIRAISKLTAQQEAYQVLDWGFEALEKGQVVQALSLAQEVAGNLPKEALSFLLLGRARLALDNESGALAAFNYAERLEPNYYQTQLQRGLLHAENNRLKQAAADLGKSLQLHPTDQAYYQLGQLHLRRGNTSQALEHLALASQGIGFISQRAQRRLAELRLPAAPEEFISIKTQQLGPTQVELVAENTGPVAVQDLVLTIQNKKGHTERLHLPVVIEPGASVLQVAELSDIEKVRIETVSIAE